MDKVYNKLVRDNIPSIIENDGCKCVTKILNEKEYKVELYKKLQEETNEVINTSNKEETLEELADVLEVLKTIAKLNNKDLDDIIEIANKKRLKRGGFEKRIFLERVQGIK